MAYETMGQKRNGDPISARDWNRIVGNFAAGVPDMMAEKGDLIVGAGVDAAARLPVGADGKYLFADSKTNTGLVMSGRPLAKAVRTYSYHTWLPRNTWLLQPYHPADNEIDTEGNYADKKFTVPISGYYLVSAEMDLVVYSDNPGIYTVKVGMFKNGSLECVLRAYQSTEDRGYILAQGWTILKLERLDYLETYIYVTTLPITSPIYKQELNCVVLSAVLL